MIKEEYQETVLTIKEMLSGASGWCTESIAFYIGWGRQGSVHEIGKPLPDWAKDYREARVLINEEGDTIIAYVDKKLLDEEVCDALAARCYDWNEQKFEELVTTEL